MGIDKDMKALSERMDSIEKLLRMLLVNGLLQNLDDSMETESKKEKSEQRISNEIESILEECNMSVAKIENIDGYQLFYIETNSVIQYKVRDYKMLDCEIKGLNEQFIPIFCFDSLNGMKRKRFVEENISFCIKEKEIHVSSKI